MNNRNAKIFKFPRREMQVSEEVNKKRGIDDPLPTAKLTKIAKEESKDKPAVVVGRDINNGELNEEHPIPIKERQIAQNGGEHNSKSENFMRMSEKGVLFEKKLTKIALPDHYEKLRLVGKIQSKLLNCLQKKKPLIPMKKLVNLEMLNEILGKKQRRLVTERPHFVDGLDVEAQSMRKNDERSTQNNQKTTISSSNKQTSQDRRLKLKLLPLRVPTFEQEGEKVFFEEEGSNFIFQPAEEGFNFFAQEDSIFEHPEVSINFCPDERKPTFFQQRKESFIEKQAGKSLFASMHQYQFDQNLFNSTKLSSPVFPSNHKPRQTEGNLGRMKVPRVETARASHSSDGFNIFAIEEEASHFFSPEKAREKRRGPADHYWRKEAGTGSSHSYY